MSSSDETQKDEIVHVGIHRISSRVGADGSAEISFAAAAPMTRTKSTPIGGSMLGMGYSMRRVLSRDDSAVSVSSKQEVEELMPSNDISSPLPLVKTKSALPSTGISHSVRRVFSKKDGEWQSSTEAEGLVPHNVKPEPVSRISSRIDASDECAEAILLPDQIDFSSLQSSGYRLRQVKSTPLGGSGYPLRRTKTSGHDDSSLHKPSSLVRNRFSSIGKKSSKGIGTKDDGSTIAESDSSSTSLSYDGRVERRKKRFSTPKIIAVIALFMLGVAAGGVYMLKPDLFGAGGGGSDLPEKIVLAHNMEAVDVVSSSAPSSQPSSQPSIPLIAIDFIPSSLPSSKPSDPLEAITISSNVPSNQPTNSLTTTLAAIQSNATSQLTQGTTTANPVVNDTIDALSPTTQTPSQQVTFFPTQNATIANAATATQNVTTANPVNDTHTTTAPPTENITVPLTPQNLTSSLADSTVLSPNATVTEILEKEVPPEDTITTFYVMADAPYSDEERYHLMPKHIDRLGSDGEFLVHLGDLQYAAVDRCREGAYYEAKEILKRSRMPTFVLPGDNDINDCKSISQGEKMWMKYFHLFDRRWVHYFDVTRWGNLGESFSFLQKGVLYLGLNMIGGDPYSWSEKKARHRKHLEMVRALFQEHEGEFEVIVLLKHADPGRNHEDFFGDGDRDGLFIDMIRRIGKPTIHFHGDNHAYYEEEAEYGVDNYMRISLDGESVAPPLRVTIDVSKANPITVSRRQSNLEVDCCSDGWPRLDDDDDYDYYY